jgi:hypothetical protein
MTTIGYGDKYPKTLPGRILTFVLSIWGVIIVSLMVIALSTYVEPTKAQLKAFHMMTHLNNKDEVYESSSQLIGAFFKVYLSWKKQKGRWSRLIYRRRVRNFRYKFRIMRAKKKLAGIHYGERNIKDVLILENDLLRCDLRKIKENQLVVLKGANKLLHKVDVMRKYENKLLELREKQRYGHKKKKRSKNKSRDKRRTRNRNDEKVTVRRDTRESSRKKRNRHSKS